MKKLRLLVCFVVSLLNPLLASQAHGLAFTEKRAALGDADAQATAPTEQEIKAEVLRLVALANQRRLASLAANPGSTKVDDDTWSVALPQTHMTVYLTVRHAAGDEASFQIASDDYASISSEHVFQIVADAMDSVAGGGEVKDKNSPSTTVMKYTTSVGTTIRLTLNAHKTMALSVREKNLKAEEKGRLAAELVNLTPTTLGGSDNPPGKPEAALKTEYQQALKSDGTCTMSLARKMFNTDTFHFLHPNNGRPEVETIRNEDMYLYLNRGDPKSVQVTSREGNGNRNWEHDYTIFHVGYSEPSSDGSYEWKEILTDNGRNAQDIAASLKQLIGLCNAQ